MSVTKWMSWEGGVDLVALSQENVPMPNVIVHMARMVHTPIGSAASGMLLLPNDDGTPKIMAFVSEDEAVGNYFADNIFAGTPFETAPTMVGEIKVDAKFPHTARVTVKVENYEVEMELSDFDPLTRVNRKSPNLPFNDDSLEAKANTVMLKVNGKEISLVIPPLGMSGGPAAVFSATGMYSR